VDLTPLLLTDGVTVEATGRVVAFEDRTWFEPPLPVRLVLIHPPPPPRPSGLGVPVQGVDLTALRNARSGDGAVEGWASLTGIWSGDTLYVTAQAPPCVESGRTEGQDWRHPPCPPPARGWPVTGHNANLPDLPEPLINSADIVNVTCFWPSDVQAVLVIAVADVGRAERLLRQRYGDSLCLIASRWTHAVINTVRAQLQQRQQAWGVWAFGNSSTQEGQLVIDAEAVHVVPDFAAWAATVPDGLLRVHPWLAPQH